MNKLIIILICFFAYLQINAQIQGQSLIDSLVSELPKVKEDSNMVNLFYQISVEYKNINIEQSIYYAEQSLLLAKKINWKKGIANAYNSLGVNYRYKSNFANALEFFQKSLNINKEIKDKRGIAINYSNIGLIYFNQNDYSKALEYYQKALKLNKELNNKNGVAINLVNIGNVYSNQSKFPQALEHYQQALKYNELLENNDGIANNFLNIGNIYFNQKDFNKALEYYINALTLNKELNNERGIAINLSNIGNIYFNQQNYTKALEYFKDALNINKILKNKKGIANNLLNLGNVYKELGEFVQSLDYLEQGLKLSEEIGSTRLKVYAYMYLSENFLAQTNLSDIFDAHFNKHPQVSRKENFTHALKYAIKSTNLADSIGLNEEQHLRYLLISKAYRGLQNYNKSLEYYKKYSQVKDSVYSLEKSKEIANLEAKRANELKDKEIKLLQSEKKAQQLQSYLLFGGIVVLIGAFSFAFSGFREKKKLSDILSIQKQKIEEQKLLVEEKNEHIYDSIRYASTIQHAILPIDSVLQNAFPDIFIFFKPKDIVSGDCYWFTEVDGFKFLAVIDCTGHGIPGSMLTVIASTVLDDAVLSKQLKDTGEILTFMNQKVTEVLNQRLSENQILDGMELALISLNGKKIQFSGAGRPLYIKNQNIDIFRTDRRGIAGRSKDINYKFKSIEIDYVKDMTIYLTSDGYADQMNENRKKYGTRRFLELLTKIADNEINEQYELLGNELAYHQGRKEQIDDITIIGLKL